MSTKIMIGGLGGQGVVTTGKLLGTAAVNTGLSASCFNEYAPTQRNGFAYSTVVVADEAVLSPITKSYNCMVFLDELSCKTQSKYLVDGGVYIVNSDLVYCTPTNPNAKVYPIPMSKIADELGNSRYLNIIALGAIIGATGLIGLSEMEDIIKKRFGKRPQAVEANLKALHAGAEAVVTEE